MSLVEWKCYACPPVGSSSMHHFFQQLHVRPGLLCFLDHSSNMLHDFHLIFYITQFILQWMKYLAKTLKDGCPDFQTIQSRINKHTGIYGLSEGIMIINAQWQGTLKQIIWGHHNVWNKIIPEPGTPNFAFIRSTSSLWIRGILSYLNLFLKYSSSPSWRRLKIKLLVWWLA